MKPKKRAVDAVIHHFQKEREAYSASAESKTQGQDAPKAKTQGKRAPKAKTRGQ